MGRFSWPVFLTFLYSLGRTQTVGQFEIPIKSDTCCQMKYELSHLFEYSRIDYVCGRNAVNFLRIVPLRLLDRTNQRVHRYFALISYDADLQHFVLGGVEPSHFSVYKNSRCARRRSARAV